MQLFISHCKYHHCSVVMSHYKYHHSPVLHSSIVKWLFVCFIKFTPHYSSWSHLYFMSFPRYIESFQPYPPEWCVRACVLTTCFSILCGLCFLALLSGGGAASHSSPPLGFNLGFITLVGELQLDQMSFDPLPSLPRNPLLDLSWESSPGC